MVAVNGLYQSVRNFETGARVKSALLQFDQTRFGHVSVNAFCGIVELSGVVSSYYDKSLAIGISERVTGVSTVVESIAIRSLPQHVPSMSGLRRPHSPPLSLRSERNGY